MFDAPTEEPEKGLIKEAAAGDEQAFQQLYNLTNRRVYAYLCRVFSDKSAADDVLVETYIEVWKSADCFKGDSKVLTWITGIARNLAMNLIRRTKTHENIEDHDHLASDDRTDVALDADKKKNVFDGAMRSLSPMHREILGLILMPGYNYEQVASLLSIPVNTVKTRVFHAKGALKKILVERGFSQNDL